MLRESMVGGFSVDYSSILSLVAKRGDTAYLSSSSLTDYKRVLCVSRVGNVDMEAV